jgi:hypothetical protein
MTMRSTIAIVTLAFIGGAAAFGWYAYNGNTPSDIPDNNLAKTAVAETNTAPLPNLIPTQPVVVDSKQTEAMLLTISARRALENGQPLKPLLPRLQAIFGGTLPDAMAVLNKTGPEPLSNAALLADLNDIAPQLIHPAGTGWKRMQYELKTLMVLRRDNDGLPPYEARLKRIRQSLLTGKTESALRLVKVLPGAANASDWIAKAEKVIAASEALNQLDQAAVNAITALPVQNPLMEQSPQEALPPAIKTDPTDFQ